MDTSPDPRLEALEQALDGMGITDTCLRELARVFFGQLLAAQRSRKVKPDLRLDRRD